MRQLLAEVLLNLSMEEKKRVIGYIEHIDLLYILKTIKDCGSSKSSHRIESEYGIGHADAEFLSGWLNSSSNNLLLSYIVQKSTIIQFQSGHWKTTQQLRINVRYFKM